LYAASVISGVGMHCEELCEPSSSDSVKGVIDDDDCILALSGRKRECRMGVVAAPVISSHHVVPKLN